MRILVLGAGVVGAASAYYLAKRGHEVTVIDRREGSGLETSFANGGQIAASLAEPWASPATPWRVLKWLGRADAPLLFHLRADPALWAWSLRFLANCFPAKTRVNTSRILRLALYSKSALSALRAETGINYDQLGKGILYVYQRPREFERALGQAGLTAGLDQKSCIAVEPALAAAKDSIAGGIYCKEDESGDAYQFTVRLAAICSGMGVKFCYGEAIKAIHAEGGKIACVETSGRRLTADIYVLALGSYSPLLARPLGVNLPIYPAKGYSATIPIKDQAKAPMVSITQDEMKLVYSRLGQRLRVAGTAEFAGYDASINQPRAKAVLNAAMRLFPGCGDEDKAELWAGLRPKTPDSVPIIGPAKYENLFLNTGHGTLGWTMACGSGLALAGMISGQKPEIDMSGFGLNRF